MYVFAFSHSAITLTERPAFSRRVLFHEQVTSTDDKSNHHEEEHELYECETIDFLS